MMDAAAIRELADACHLRARERDDAEGKLLVEYAIDYERRSEIARMLGISGYETPQWDILMVRLNECLTTFRLKAR
jgi:hypothetical protein